MSIHLLLCFMLIGLVLLQQGKGAELGATLGGGSNTLFGAGGATSFITRLTTGTAIAFMVTSVLLVRTYGSGISSPIGGDDALLEGSLLKGVEAPVIDEPGDAAVGDAPVKSEASTPSAVEAARSQAGATTASVDAPPPEAAASPALSAPLANQETAPVASPGSSVEGEEKAQ